MFADGSSTTGCARMVHQDVPGWRAWAALGQLAPRRVDYLLLPQQGPQQRSACRPWPRGPLALAARRCSWCHRRRRDTFDQALASAAEAPSIANGQWREARASRRQGRCTSTARALLRIAAVVTAIAHPTAHSAPPSLGGGMMICLLHTLSFQHNNTNTSSASTLPLVTRLCKGAPLGPSICSPVAPLSCLMPSRAVDARPMARWGTACKPSRKALPKIPPPQRMWVHSQKRAR